MTLSTRRTVLSCGTALLAQIGRVSAASPLPTLRRGVALSSWFSNAPRQPLFERDFRQIAAAGFDHVRLTVNPELIGYRSAPTAGGPRPDPSACRWDGVDNAVSMGVRNGLTVVFNIHPEFDYKNRLTAESYIRVDLVSFAAFVARRYKDVPIDKFAFELINEPFFNKSPGLYRNFIVEMVNSVRSAMPAHLLLIGGHAGNGIPDLCAMAPLDDPRIVYLFHYYQPFIVTHQGIGFGFPGMQIRAFRHVPYPASRVDPGVDYAPGATSTAEASQELRDYVTARWGANHILETVQPVADWASGNRQRVMCTEFGCFRGFIDPGSRYGWIGDTRRAFEKLNMGWTVWDYADIFGITTPVGATVTNPSDQAVVLVDPEHGSRKFEPAALAALGLDPV